MQQRYHAEKIKKENDAGRIKRAVNEAYSEKSAERTEQYQGQQIFAGNGFCQKGKGIQDEQAEPQQSQQAGIKKLAQPQILDMPGQVIVRR